MCVWGVRATGTCAQAKNKHQRECVYVCVEGGYDKSGVCVCVCVLCVCMCVYGGRDYKSM